MISIKRPKRQFFCLRSRETDRPSQLILPSHPAPPTLYNYLQYLFIRQQLCSIWTLLLARKVLCPPSNGVYNWSPLFTAPCRLINWRFVAVEMSAWNIPCRTHWTWKCTKRQRRIPADFTFWCDGIPHSYCYVVQYLYSTPSARHGLNISIIRIPNHSTRLRTDF